jgi:hypothetical protein
MRYPKIKDMPLFLDTATWTWSRRKKTFWIGHEADGTKWLVKGRGSVYALRERSSAFLMQSLGINCQSSVYISLNTDSLPLQDNPDLEKFQLAIRYIDEHNGDCKDEKCPKKVFVENFESTPRKISFLEHCSVINAIDWVKVQLLACLCGAHEPSQRLMSKDHVMYIIDNEQMFSNQPNSPITGAKHWFDFEFYEAMTWTLNLCKELSSINENDVRTFTNIPNGYLLDEPYPLVDLMKDAILFAKKFLKEYS